MEFGGVEKRPSPEPMRGGALDGKWGRHRCRPHSHRRVDALAFCGTSGGPSTPHGPSRTWRPMSDPARQVIRPFAAGFRTGARAGIRLSLPRFSHSHGGPKAPTHAITALAWPRPRPFTVPFAAAISGLRLLPSHGPARFPACPVTQRRSHLKRPGLPLAEASRMPFLDGRVDRCHRHPWDKKPRNFKAFGPELCSPFCPEDNWKVRFKRPSGNIHNRDFSTPGRIACGHGWISQRFVVFVIELSAEGERNRASVVPNSRSVGSVARQRFAFALSRRDCAVQAAAIATRST